ncbi:MAG: hypothetical protein ACREQN_16260 [Candidatus Binataceae bacterium]
MKRAVTLMLAVALLALPALSYAQYSDNSNASLVRAQNYNDVDDGQLLKLVSYMLNPIGYTLEWTITRPLHHAATQTSLAPVLSGDTNPLYFGENRNADKLPPGTFTTPIETYPDIAALEAQKAQESSQTPGQLTKPYHTPSMSAPSPGAAGSRVASPSYTGQSAIH